MSLCVLCAQKRVPCCINRDILVTLGDVNRIAEHTGSDQFYQYRQPSSPKYIDQDDDPSWNLMTVQVDGSRRVLKNVGANLCYFLTSQGCRLPSTIRPLVCRLHPVEYSEAGITGFSDECPVEFLPETETLLDSLRMNLTEAEQWRSQLYEELFQDFHKQKKAV